MLEVCKKTSYFIVWLLYVQLLGGQNRYRLVQGHSQLFVSGGNFHEISFDDIIVVIQLWYNFFANSHR